MGTHLRLTRSGGLAGISMVADVDLDELPEPTASEAREALAAIDFDPTPPPPIMPDGYQYDLVVEDSTTRSTTARDPFLSPGFRALLDVLMPLATPE
jgi:hypothetical protein